MASITAQLQNAAPRNQQLLDILSETDNAPSALDQQKRYILDLDNQLQDVKKRIATLERDRSKEHKDHEKYRDSVMKRWAYKVTGNKEKFAAKAEKEEREYFDVLQKLHQATTLEENLQGMRAEAFGVQQGFEQACTRRAAAQTDLDTLYASIFQGPTPSFPEEDAAERNMESASQAYNYTSAKLEADRKVQYILEEASKRIKSSLLDIEDALDASRLDMFGGGATADMMERNALQKAEMNVAQAQMMVVQAQHISPEVRDLPPVNIAQGNLFSDVLFDNIFSDMEFHDKIKASRAEVQRCQNALLAQLTAAKERTQILEQQSKTQSGVLKTAREELQKTRQNIFGRLAEGDVLKSTPGQPEAPPAYY
ncbi:hypothetical protein O1611_g6627 [Lasiodiplodia mahajangana]|uniref:Uncharacterized protein n=1 Tax=Lasiodiplodia mahajangana TaxID=1108764 RepID=A0ACC2JHN5_9PEZI|nr:hypothetical protein O1611_g6627 [Lasiodiplodia mahajangana]